MRENRTLRSTWRGLETWHGRDTETLPKETGSNRESKPRPTPARQSSTLPSRKYEAMGPLLTSKVLEQLRAAARAGAATVECSLDLQRSTTMVEVGVSGWIWKGQRFPYPDSCKDRTIYHWDGETFQPAARYTTSLFKLVPTDWGPPTFEIDGIKMLPTARISPYVDAERKVSLIRPRGKVILDTCGGLGYFAAWCLQGQASASTFLRKESRGHLAAQFKSVVA